MAPRLNWSTELKKIIFKDALDCYHRYARDRENGLQKLHEIDFIRLPESIKDSDDEIAKKLYWELKELIIQFFRKAFENFEETKDTFYRARVEENIKWGLDRIYGLADKLALGEVSENLFAKEYEDMLDRLERWISEDYERLFKCYHDGCYYLFNQLKNPSLNLAGYLSIYNAFNLIPSNLWKRVGRRDKCFIHFYEYCKIGGEPIQLWFCNFILKNIDFFLNNYSYLDIFDYSRSLLFKDHYFLAILEHVSRGCDEESLNSKISNMLTEIISREASLKGKGGLLKSFFKQFVNALKRIYPNLSWKPMDTLFYELVELYEFLIPQNGMLEYEIFRVAANSGYACLPKVSIIYEEGDTYKEKEVDLLIVEDGRLSFVEITFRRNIKECEEKLNSIVDRLEESIGGFRFEKYIVTRDNFRDFISSLSNSLHLPTL